MALRHLNGDLKTPKRYNRQAVNQGRSRTKEIKCPSLGRETHPIARQSIGNLHPY